MNKGDELFNEHPLLNDVVVREVLKYSALSDLKRHRLVCRHWNELSLSRLRSDMTLHLYFTDGQRKVSSNLLTKHYDGVSAAGLLSLMDKEDHSRPGSSELLQMSSKPFKNYHLNAWPFCGDPAVFANRNAVELLTRVGASMKSLILKNCDIQRSQPPIPMLPKSVTFLTFTPNLETLVVEFEQGVRTVIKLAPLFEGVETTLSLKSLDLLYSLSYDAIDYWNLCQKFPNFLSQLECLSIPIRNDNSSCSNMTKVVQCHRTTLQRLTLLRDPFISPCRVLAFTEEMVALTELTIWGPLVDSLEFLRWMPKLEKLTITQSCYEIQDKLKRFLGRDLIHEPARHKIINYLLHNTRRSMMNNVVMHQMCSFSLDAYLLGPSDLTLLQKWMPNLQTLKAVLDYITLPLVIHFWPGLRELRCLLGGLIGDDAITGMYGVPKKGENSRAFQSPGISALTDLEIFGLETYCNVGELTDLSAREGFLKLERLKFLEICVSKEFSHKMITKLKAKIAYVNVIRSGRYIAREGAEHAVLFGKCCARRKYNDVFHMND